MLPPFLLFLIFSFLILYFSVESSPPPIAYILQPPFLCCPITLLPFLIFSFLSLFSSVDSSPPSIPRLLIHNPLFLCCLIPSSYRSYSYSSSSLALLPHYPRSVLLFLICASYVHSSFLLFHIFLFPFLFLQTPIYSVILLSVDHIFSHSPSYVPSSCSLHI